MTTAFFATCTCPKVWHGVLPPPCLVHNPPGPSFTFTKTTTTTTDEHTDYRCPNCGKRYRRYGDPYSCCVDHSPGECCHAFEQRITKKGYPKSRIHTAFPVSP